MITALIAIVIAYLLGSLSTGILLSKFLGFDDPRGGGSGNPGATNVLRTAGKKQALWVLGGDILKGILAVLIGRILGVEGFFLGLVAFAAVVGHVFPLYFKFKGGKGVATGLGALIMLAFWPTLIALGIWLVIVAITRYVSLASMVAAISIPITTLFFGQHAYVIPAFLIAALIIWRHQANIERLVNKTENKLKL